MEDIFTIAQVAALTGVSIHTLRYYERVGLLDRVDRANSGHRRYGEADVNRINFLKRLRKTGMSISEMQRFVALYRAGDDTLSERRAMLEDHRRAIQAQIADLQEIIAFIDDKIATYDEQERINSR
ncbi:MAG: MerR family transcriptional regulator [Chloroflexaceae bacterium]|nr:MerR family transcriptional regulator [Chloroflexaceae bacterium]NJL35014.1 MerR family transcriptional regulator [Chloroflexaceae bacterium]NJO05686.1 MerR family transcriptional regulator [Chloroflexaceae bacterium]